MVVLAYAEDATKRDLDASESKKKGYRGGNIFKNK
jgi:hypothetical protein